MLVSTKLIVSISFDILNLFNAEMNTIGAQSTNLSFLLNSFLYLSIVFVSFSIKSHLLTITINGFFFS
jgi:hypothetical protein